ncbi:MAG: simple sugar transport system ATP-binding protein [Frankiales bacterium]|nr:simple sugar transport system ATP-binding protein [Frankiales bacterium]
MSIGSEAVTASGVNPPAVTAVHVTKRFGATVALDDVDLTVQPGEVHALVGRNGAGKSTLVSILTGLQTPDTGELAFGGRPAPAPADREAWRRVVACVYQHLTIIPTLTVAENLFLNRQTESSGVIHWPQIRRRAADLLDSWQLDVDVRRMAGELTVEQRQMIEIARALSLGARFIILDEPTARLDASGVTRLLNRIRVLQQQGVTFLFISHHLQEIFDLCDSVTVFRDAKHVLTAPVADIAHGELVDAMTGEHVAKGEDPRRPAPRDTAPMLTVSGLVTTPSVAKLSFEVAAGEVVGLAGGGGSGKFAVAECIVGLRRPVAGQIAVAGARLHPGSVTAALRAGVGFVPEDRHEQGMVADLSIGENVTMTVWDRLTRFRVCLSPRRRAVRAQQMIDRLGIVAPGPEIEASALSGGNQQKVVMGRAIISTPRMLVLMSPTAGVDVRSKTALMEQAVHAAEGDAGVLVVTDDLDDLRYCHRVLVLFRGELRAQISGTWDDATVVAEMEGVDLGNDRPGTAPTDGTGRDDD